MTKYVLAGGSDKLYSDYGKRLAEFVRKEVAAPVLLNCFFSQPPETREAKQAEWKDWHTENFGFADKVMHAEEAAFLDQLAESDVVYLHGGETWRLIEAFSDVKNVKKAFEGKIVIGSSAGANYLSRFCYSPSKDVIHKGSGILDIGVVVHYGVDSFNGKQYSMDQWRDAATKIRTKIGESPLILLPEGNFTVIEQ